MVDYSVGQQWLDASENSFLVSKISRESDFPDPLSFFSLYSVIINEEPMHHMVEYPFAPFKGRSLEMETPTRYGERREPKDYGFWISTLVRFLGSPPLVEYISDSNRKVKLTPFGEHLFPTLMRVFADLYLQNDRLKEAVVAYQAPQG